ncbi:MAG: biotin--[Clostridia bacterium]|nr:biotin--[acetyl-CoA-carboxylase] ligase [Clostridia bacterium]
MKTDLEKIRALLTADEDIIIETVAVTASTNEDIKAKAKAGAPEISLLIADKQTKGKGSKGRSFFSPDSTGCYMSFLLRPKLRPEECTLLTSIAAVATAEAIEKVTNKAADIKWVNDIYMGGKKVAGILTEGAIINKDEISYAVVGIGINLTVPEEGFPEEIKNIAGTLGTAEIKNELIAEIINRFVYYYRKLPDNSYIQAYRKRLFFLGKEITVIQGDNSFSAKAIDIDAMCRLRVSTHEGEKLLSAGEISIKL